MTDKRSLFLVLLLLPALMLSCSQGTDEEGPGSTVQQFYRHLNDGDYQAAKELYDSEARQTVEDPELFSESGFRSWADEQTKRGSITGVKIVQELDDETGTEIEYEIAYRDGSSKKSRVRLTQEEGEWKMGFAMDVAP